MRIWVKKPCILPIANLGMISLLLQLQTYTLHNGHLFPRQIQKNQIQKTNQRRQIEIGKSS